MLFLRSQDLFRNRRLRFEFLASVICFNHIFKSTGCNDLLFAGFGRFECLLCAMFYITCLRKRFDLIFQWPIYCANLHSGKCAELLEGLGHIGGATQPKAVARRHGQLVMRQIQEDSERRLKSKRDVFASLSIDLEAYPITETHVRSLA